MRHFSLKWIVPLFSGACAALGQAPFDLWFIALPAFAGLIWCFCQGGGGWRDAFRVGWIGGVGYFAVALHWIVEPFLVDVARHGWMAPFAVVFLSSGLALLWGGAYAVTARFFGSSALGLGAVWTSVEMLRGWLFTGFPWALVGHIWIDTPVRVLASWVGPHGLTLFTCILAALPFALHSKIRGILVSAIIFGAAFAVSLWVIGTTSLTESGKVVRLVQPNAPQHEKWDPEKINEFFWRQIDATQAPGDPDLIVWPETALAWRFDNAQDALDIMREAARGRDLIFGVNDYVDGRYRNALVLMGRDGAIRDVYHKHHLVPFGEYLPLAPYLSKLGLSGIAERAGGFVPGPGVRLIDVEGVGEILPLVCYELIFPRNLSVDARADLIVQITNDAWFGRFSGPYQHLAQARLRAVEQGLPLVRAANTGVSALIDPLGRVVDSLPLEQAGFIDVVPDLPLAMTLYAKFGDWPVRALLVLLIFGMIGANFRSLPKK